MATINIETYKVIVHEAEEGGVWGEVLELPGCVSQGETMEEFRDNIREAIAAVLESATDQTPRIEFHFEQMTPGKDDISEFSIQPSTWTSAS